MRDKIYNWGYFGVKDICAFFELEMTYLVPRASV